jgi:hypothetical protein
MTKKLVFFLIIVLAVVTFSSCTSKTKSGKPRSIGNTSEILVVVENEKLWSNGIGKSIRETFAKEQYGLNQSEPLFRLSHVQIKSFSDLFKKHHNLLIVEIDKAVKKPKIESSDDLWAKPQKIFKITAATNKEIVDVILNNKDVFIEAFQQTDRDRIMEVFRPSQNKEAVAEINTVTGIKMVIPKDYYLAKSLDDFMWIRKEAGEYSQGIFIISGDYLDTVQFSKESIISRINLGLKNNVPGSVYESYMTTDNEHILPIRKVLKDFPAGFAVEVVGAWTVENDFMGGPFKSYTFYNEKTGKIITLMAYVYKPNEKKRDLLKQIEAILYTAKF